MKQEIPKQYQRISTTRKVKVVKIGDKNKGVYDGPGEDVIVDTRLDYPIGYQPILDQLRDIFSCVFIALHPFVFIDGLDPNKTQKGSLDLNRSEINGALTLERLSQLREEHAIGRDFDFETFEQFEKLNGQTKKWSDVAPACGLPHLKDVSRAIHSETILIKREHEDREGAKRLTSYCEREKLFWPLRGRSEIFSNVVF